MRKDGLTEQDAFCAVAPGTIITAWESAGEVPDEAEVGLRLLDAGDAEAALQSLIRKGAADQGVEITAEWLKNRFSLLASEDLSWTARYHQLLTRTQRRPYLPALPEEAEWAASRYPHLGKADGTTLRTEIQAELDEWGVTSPEARREQAEYIAAMDGAISEYRAAVEGARYDEILDAQSGA